MEFSVANSAPFPWESAWGSGSRVTLIGNKVIWFTPRLVLISLLHYIETYNYLQIISQINCLNLHINKSGQSWVLLWKKYFSAVYKGPDFKRGTDASSASVFIFCANWFNTNDARRTKTHMGWTLQGCQFNLKWLDRKSLGHQTLL